MSERGALHPDAERLFGAIADLGEPDLTTMTPAEARAARRARPVGSPAPIATEDVDVAGVPTRIYRGRAGGSSTAPVVWLHGGGWVMGGWYTHDEIFRRVATGAGVDLVAPEYRLAPEDPFPAGLDDSAAVVDAVANDPARYGLTSVPLVLAGDSAGGNLAAAIALGGRVKASALALVYPVTDARLAGPSYEEPQTGSYLTPEWMAWFRGHYLTDDGQAQDWRASPNLASHEQFAGLPPTLVVVATHDPLRSEGEEFARLVTVAGGTVDTITADGWPHGFLSMAAGSSDAAGYLDRVAAFIAAHAGVVSPGQ